MRARDEGVLAEGDAAAAVAAEVGHDMANLVVVAGTTALAGGGGRDLVLFARHFDVGFCCGGGSGLVVWMGGRWVAFGGEGKDWRCFRREGGDGKVWTAELPGR